MTVVCFIIAPAPYRGLNVTTLNRQAMFHELRETCMNIKEAMGRRLFRAVAYGRLPTMEDLLDEFAMVRLKRMGYAGVRARRRPSSRRPRDDAKTGCSTTCAIATC